jgi:hypothetical protein
VIDAVQNTWVVKVLLAESTTEPLAQVPVKSASTPTTTELNW